MSRAAQNFRQRDLMRAVKAAEAVGKTVREIRVDKTGAHIVVAEGEDKTNREGNTETYEAPALRARLRQSPRETHVLLAAEGLSQSAASRRTLRSSRKSCELKAADLFLWRSQLR